MTKAMIVEIGEFVYVISGPKAYEIDPHQGTSLTDLNMVAISDPGVKATWSDPVDVPDFEQKNIIAEYTVGKNGAKIELYLSDMGTAGKDAFEISGR